MPVHVNLLTNALKYTPAGRRIQVSVCRGKRGVEARSRGIGFGATFTVFLPQARVPQALVSSAALPPHVRRRVLVVEDNDDAREMLRTMLELQGHEVFEAADGAAGVSMATKFRPEVALVDIGLPVMDGYEVARYIRRELGPTRLIAISGYGRPEDRQRALEAGFDEHLVKPVDAPHLVAMLCEASGQALPHSP
jgi:CheY-like chemotaxis protein